MTLGQFFALGCACIALNSAAVCVFAPRSPHGSYRNARFAIAALLALYAAVGGLGAFWQSHFESSLPCTTYLYHTPGWSLLLIAALLAFALFLLGYAIVKGPRKPNSTV